MFVLGVVNWGAGASPALLSSSTGWDHRTPLRWCCCAGCSQQRGLASWGAGEGGLNSQLGSEFRAPRGWLITHWGLAPQTGGAQSPGPCFSKMQSMFRHHEKGCSVVGISHLPSGRKWEGARDREEDVCSLFTVPGKFCDASHLSSFQWSSSTLARLGKPQKATGDWKTLFNFFF